MEKNYYKGEHNSSSKSKPSALKRFIYSKEYLYDNPKHIKSQKNSNPMIKFFKFIFIILFILIIGVIIFFVPYIAIAANSYANGLDTSRIDINTVPHIYDKDGNLVAIMYGYYDTGDEDFVPTYSSAYVDISTLPTYVGDAFTAIEDETFYSNNGISIKRLIVATFNYIVKGDSSFGGSTITQQLVKVATGDNSHSATRKAREIGTALYITDNWSKEKILASYINLVYYGNGAYGIYEASYTYFNTSPQNLNIAQAAILAALPNSPETLNPYGGEECLNKLISRQKVVLSKMLELSLITQAEYDEAIAYNITFSNGASSLSKNDPAIEQYLSIALTQAIELVEEEYSCDYEKAVEKILNGSTNIYLNMDTELQKESYNIAVSTYADYGDLEIGAVMTSKSGEVLAIITSRTGSEIDHAYTMTRQTGSAIKPISVYSPAYDLGILTPTSYVTDSPVSVTNSSGVWNVTNASNTYRGTITVNDAIAYSLNTIAVTTLESVTITKSYEYVKSFGITSIVKDDLYYPALALGGLTYGVSPYEMTQAYNVFNNNGTFRSISTIKSITIDETSITPNSNEHQVISSEANEMMKTSLKCVAKYGTGKAANLSNTTAYLKTGTTNDVKDVWTCGFTDDVTLCIWGGYDTPQTVSIYNVNALWKNLMNNYYN